MNQADWIRKKARNLGRGCLILPISLLFLLIGCSVSRMYHSTLESKAKRLGLVEHRVQVGDSDVHYWIGGSGPPLMILHGFGGNGLRTWSNQIRALSNQHTIIVPDLVWFGESSSELAPSLNVQADTFLALIRQLGLKSVDVMGISYGGFVTIQMKKDADDEVGRIIIVDSPGGHFGEDDEAEMLARFGAENPEAIFIPKDWKAVRTLIQLVFHHPPWLPSWVYRDVKEEVFSHNHPEHRVLLTELRGREAEFFEQDWSDTKALVVWGEYDPVFPQALGEAVSDTLGADFVVVEDAGHGPNMEHGRRFNRIVLDWLASERTDH